MEQVILGYLPGYMWSQGTLQSTGAAIPPTQHMDRKTGDIKYYVRPIFAHGPTVGMFISRKGIMESIAKGTY